MKVSEVDITKTHNAFDSKPSRTRTHTAHGLNNTTNNGNDVNNNNRGKISIGDYSGNPWDDDAGAGNGDARPRISVTNAPQNKVFFRQDLPYFYLISVFF